MQRSAVQLASLTDTPTDLSAPQRSDGWRFRRVWISGACGLWLGASVVILDFWPLGHAQDIRADVFSSDLLLGFLLSGFVIGLLVAAAIALCRRHLRRAASSIIALTALPFCFVLPSTTSLFDPWFWYVIANNARLQAVIANIAADQPKFAVLESEDVSTGFAGVNPNHFLFIVYDESDDLGLESSERPVIWKTRTILWSGLPFPKGRRLYGHIFRVDDFE